MSTRAAHDGELELLRRLGDAKSEALYWQRRYTEIREELMRALLEREELRVQYEHAVEAAEEKLNG